MSSFESTVALYLWRTRFGVHTAELDALAMDMQLLGCISGLVSLRCNHEVAQLHGPHRERDRFARSPVARLACTGRRRRVWRLVRHEARRCLRARLAIPWPDRGAWP